ncbi:EcsC family protein [Marinicrinis sediminis]|uniref:EcsC family protein n=1 Tax=Marinicrinis sediminis TaxID=1652465 RepID=A0ABW5RFD2_9BACL
MEDWSTYYEKRVRRDLLTWENEIRASDSPLSRASQGLSRKINRWIPQKAHDALTSAIKGMVKSVLTGAQFIPKPIADPSLSLYERDEQAKLVIGKYRKIAATEGAATGAGGIILGMVDFPALLAIKMNMLFELAPLYGFETRSYRERLFILHVFQLTYSSSQTRNRIFHTIRHWQPDTTISEPDWQTFQQEYRDSMDLRKLLQLLPGIGAVVGAWANDGLTKELGRNAICSYQSRYLSVNNR